MKFGVVVFPGSNCDEDLVYTLRDVLHQDVVKLWHKDTDLQDVDFVFLPGGFSYGDYLRSGAIARFSPIMNEVVAHANKGGYVMGICNGFQILCEAKLLPGALLHNDSRKFICKNVYLKPVSKTALPTRDSTLKRLIKFRLHTEKGSFLPEMMSARRSFRTTRFCSAIATSKEKQRKSLIRMVLCSTSRVFATSSAMCLV